jgi:hypothetical protein
MNTNRNTTAPMPEGDEFDWRWVGEPESWMGLRSEKAMTLRPTGALAASEPQPGRAARLMRSFLSLINR